MDRVGPDPAATVRAILAANRYMTLATAGADGRPWASPVWFATADQHEFFWVSWPHVQHSRNLAARPEVAIVVFDSQVRVGEGQAVYMAATAQEVTGPEIDRGIGVFAREGAAQGLREWTRDDVTPPASLRLYRAVATEHFLLGNERDERIAVRLSPA
jgi:nitroimidazol reductase NimA-like FMN-containing flavoprotein (pyridoxamine 5'-phosphate oxidase superfamily)